MDPQSSEPLLLPTLRKGQACINCRRRKIRCGGERPVCEQCIYSEREEDCEYTDTGRSTTAMLEDNIAHLEARIQQLENPDNSESVTLYQPYLQLPLQSGSGYRHDDLLLPPLPTSSSSIVPSTPKPEVPQQASSSWWTSENTPPNILEILLENFLPFASEFGFFMHLLRFRNSALLPYAIGHRDRPSRFLLSTVSLWGIHLSTSDSLTDVENAFLSRSVALASTALSDQHPSKIIHAIQGEILLSYYFLRTRRFLEGRYHCSVAVSLVLGSGLHQIHAPRHTDPLNVGALKEPHDAIETGERIRGFWSCLILDQSWSVVLGTQVYLAYDRDDPRSRIDSPWPLDMEVYEQASLLSLPISENTISNFLSGLIGNSGPGSGMEMHAKSSILYNRATQLAKEWTPGSDTPFASILLFDSFVANYRESLPPFHCAAEDVSHSVTRTLVVAHTLAHMSTVQLHSMLVREDPHYWEVSLSAAKAIVNVVDQVDMTDFVFINPIMAVVWPTAAAVLVAEISRLQSLPLHDNGEEMELRTAAEKIIATMSMFSAYCPLMKSEYAKLAESYANIGVVE